MKRFLAIFLAMVMCFSFAPMAFAAEVTIPTEFEEDGGFITFDENGEAVVELPSSVINSTITPFGGGVETWSDTSSNYVYVGRVPMEGNNLTPVKTIGVDNYNLGIRVNSYTCSKNVRLSIQIRKAYTSTVLADGLSNLGKTGNNIETGLAYVKKGDKVQIFFKITDANGNYDDNLPCTLNYSYRYVYRF